MPTHRRLLDTFGFMSGYSIVCGVPPGGSNKVNDEYNIVQISMVSNGGEIGIDIRNESENLRTSSSVCTAHCTH